MGETASRIREAAKWQAELQASIARNLMSDYVNIVSDLAKSYEVAGRNGDRMSRATQDLREEFGLSADQAKELSAAIVDIGNSGSSDEMADSLQRVFDLINDMGIPLADMDSDLRMAILNMIELEEATARVETAMNNASAAAANMNTGSFSALAGLSGDQLLPPEAEGGGGGGGGRSRVDPAQARLDRLIESLKTEREVLEEWRSAALADLNTANEQELAILGGFNEAKIRLEEEYQGRLKSIRGASSMDAVSSVISTGQDVLAAFGSSNERYLKAAQAFGAGLALINAYQAASETLKDPSLPWFARVAAAGSVLAAGVGFANSIKNMSSSGASAGASSSASTAATASTTQSQQINLSITGESFTQGQVVDLVSQLQSELDNGRTLVMPRSA